MSLRNVLFMKKIVLLLFLFNVIKLSAQVPTDLDDRMLFRFSQNQLSDMSALDTNHVKYLNFFVTHSYYFEDVVEVPNEKLADYPNIIEYLSLPIDYQIAIPVSEENFNIFMYDVQFFENKQSTYLLGDSNKVVVLRSKIEINNMFNQMIH